MALMNLISKETVETGLSVRYNKDYKFQLRRQSTSEGNQFYLLENLNRKEAIQIQREIFDRFRACLKEMERDHKSDSLDPTSKIKRIFFKDEECYVLRLPADASGLLEIHEIRKTAGFQAALHLPLEALSSLVPLLYHAKLDHPNDVFDRIVKYHKLFHFSFTEHSESITSALALRRDVLSQIDEYVPSLVAKNLELDESLKSSSTVSDKGDRGLSDAAKSKDTAGKFKPKLGQKGDKQNYDVDYEALFQSQHSASPEKEPKSADDQTKQGAPASSTTFPVPLDAGDIKSFTKMPFRCELSKEDVTHLREHFLQDRNCELFLGFEILDAIFRANGKFKTYRFPLYYMKVKLEESGRVVFLHPDQSGEIFLNHLALATIVESFAPKSQSGDALEQFFTTILAQKIEIEGRLSRLQISRNLPVHPQVFDRIREILIGLPGENGKGGILGQLSLVGIACDLESVAIYKAPTAGSPLRRALEQDMDRIQSLAHEEPERFYRSLLGQVLTPEMSPLLSATAEFCKTPYLPGALPKSLRKLMDRLNKHDLMLLEGPPGTGKTFSIMNVLIHCINTRKRLLIISDQKAAIHALTEKVQEYLVGKDFQSPQAKAQLSLWRNAVKVVDELPSGPVSLSQWMAMLVKMLGTENAQDIHAAPLDPKIEQAINKIDEEIAKHKQLIQKQVERMQNQDGSPVTPKYLHPTTKEDIEDSLAFLEFLEQKDTNKLVKQYITHVQILLQGSYPALHHDIRIDPENIVADLAQVESQIKLLEDLVASKPRKREEFLALCDKVAQSELITYLKQLWDKAFPLDKQGKQKLWPSLTSYLRYPLIKVWRSNLDVYRNFQDLLKSLKENKNSGAILRQLEQVYAALVADDDNRSCLALEFCHFRLLNSEPAASSIQSILMKIKQLQAQRDGLIKTLFIGQLEQIVHHSMQTDPKRKTSPMTTLISLIEALKDSSSIDHGSGASLLREFQEALYQAFPIWICRKQAVSFLFPSKEQIFDLVIVDEAGQCRVDDAIPLLHRAKKLMVVGDEKQTVLDKNSPIDDYLFRDFNLEDHLSQTQARGMKGGGSNIFSLVKAMKQTGVMLDEHYRCPPEIIRYSNEYVYDSGLKIMQWQHPSASASVVVDYSEKSSAATKKPTSGKFKDIETEVIDRFLKFVADSVKKIEKETGKRINMETDVALCYFLLKNEPYIKEVKSQFLQKLGRGDDVLDGAGAALQGKERDYIFYLWDVTRGNLKSFRQGDDPDKRKGELNVLMSRPKIRAYHYLHPQFESLKHDSATITDFLWKAYQRQTEKKSRSSFVTRKKRPGLEFRPWQRSSGDLMQALLTQVSQTNAASEVVLPESHCSVVVGDPKRKVDLMLLNATVQGKSLGLVDLSAFCDGSDSADEIVDYFFQLERAMPKIEPVFLYLHELIDIRSAAFQHIVANLDRAKFKMAA
ncbi:MAG: hypothetical protein ACOH5I_20080 [Oligoflexus sp.]